MIDFYKTDKFNKSVLNFIKIKSFDIIFNNISLNIYIKHDGFIIPGSSIKNDTISLYPSLFMDPIFNDHEFTVEHITAILGHEFGHYKFNHDRMIAINPTEEEFYADQYSIKILSKLNINTFYMKDSLKLILSIKNGIGIKDDKYLIERINKLNE